MTQRADCRKILLIKAAQFYQRACITAESILFRPCSLNTQIIALAHLSLKARTFRAFSRNAF